MKIVSIGEITIDHYLRQDLYFVGGISLNFAVNAKRYGAEEVALISCLGDEPEAIKVLETLAKEGVEHSHVAVLAGETATCAIDVDDEANRFFPKGGYKLNVLEQMGLDDASKAFIQQHDIYVTMYGFGQPTSFLDELLLLPRTDRKIVVDFGDWSNGRRKAVPMETFEQIDLAFISGDEATVADLASMAAADCLIVVTLGAGGSVALTDEGPIFQKALPAKKVDSTGCGDAFQAAFTTSYFGDGDVAAALHAGASQAAIVLQHFGAFEQQAF